MKPSMVWIATAALLCLGATRIISQQPPPDVASVEALAAHPEQFGDPRVRVTIFKALDASPDVAAAAVEIVMGSKELTADQQIWRRFNAALANADPVRRKAILDRAAKTTPLRDVRMLAVVVEALTDDDAGVRSRAIGILEAQPALRKNAAVAEALARMGKPDSTVVLPGFDAFKTSVQPVLEAMGPDKKRCSDCHEVHSVLRLREMEDAPSPDRVLRERYQAALRVVDLEVPERSLLLRKPTSPKRDAALTHEGDVRFEPDSQEYRAILAWIKTGGIQR